MTGFNFNLLQLSPPQSAAFPVTQVPQTKIPATLPALKSSHSPSHSRGRGSTHLPYANLTRYQHALLIKDARPERVSAQAKPGPSSKLPIIGLQVLAQFNLSTTTSPPPDLYLNLQLAVGLLEKSFSTSFLPLISSTSSVYPAFFTAGHDLNLALFTPLSFFLPIRLHTILL